MEIARFVIRSPLHMNSLLWHSVSFTVSNRDHDHTTYFIYQGLIEISSYQHVFFLFLSCCILVLAFSLLFFFCSYFLIPWNVYAFTSKCIWCWRRCECHNRGVCGSQKTQSMWCWKEDSHRFWVSNSDYQTCMTSAFTCWAIWLPPISFFKIIIS